MALSGIVGTGVVVVSPGFIGVLPETKVLLAVCPVPAVAAVEVAGAV